MALKKSVNGIKVVIPSAILVTIFMSLASFVYAEIKKIPLMEQKQKNISELQREMNKDVKEMSRRVYEMHGKMMGDK